MKSHLLISTLVVASAVACTKSGSSDSAPSSSISAEKPSTVVASLTTKVVEVGAAYGNGLSSVNAASLRNGPSRLSADSYCAEHGEPVGLDSSTHTPLTTSSACTTAGHSWESSSSTPYCRMNFTDKEYAGMAFYCLIAKDTGAPDSVQGAFGLYGNIACALERAGITWHDTDPGSDDTMNFTFDTNCFTTDQLNDVCGSGQTSCDITGAQVRALRNPDAYYDSSLKMSLSLGGGSVFFNAKIKVSDGVTELAINNNGGGVADQNDAYSVKYEESTKKFTYEARFDRIDCIKSGSCRWGRHYRLIADLQDSAADPIPENIEGVMSNLYANGTDNGDGGGTASDGNISDGEIDSYVSELTTIKGSLVTTGLTGAHYGLSGKATRADAINGTDLAAGQKMIACYSNNAATTNTACTSVTAMTVPTGALAFFLPGSATYRGTTANAANKYQDNTSWWTALSGLSFTSVDISRTEP